MHKVRVKSPLACCFHVQSSSTAHTRQSDAHSKMSPPGDEMRAAAAPDTAAADTVAAAKKDGPDAAQFELFVPSADSIAISGRHFTDPLGRVLGLRGANVGSASKV